MDGSMKIHFVRRVCSDDEIAVATCMQNMAEFVQGGPDFYSLAEAMQDRYLALLTVQSAKEGKVLEASPQIWMK